MKRVLILSFSPIKRDPRVIRQLRALQRQYHVSIAGFGPPPESVPDFYDVSGKPSHFLDKAAKGFLLLSRQFESYYWRLACVRNALSALKAKKFDLVIANDVETLPLALHLSEGAPVLLDAHEYSPRQFEDLFRWRVFFSRFKTYLCQRYLPLASAMTTVCQGIADEYRKFGCSPRVVFNCPDAQELSANTVDPQNIKLIHHGIAAPSRKLELMISMMSHLDHRYSLDLMLVKNNNNSYYDQLAELARKNPKVRLIEPVPMEQISCKINSYDIGVFLLPPVNFNYAMALPNKFFEFIQARLAVAIGPSPEMHKVIQKFGCGIVSKSFSPRDLADSISSLSPTEIEALKIKSDIASSHFNSANSMKVFCEEVQRLVPV